MIARHRRGKNRERPGRLPVLGTLRQVPGVYRRHWKLLVPICVLVLLPEVLVEVGLEQVDTDGLSGGETAALAGAAAAAVIVSLLGEAIFAGIVAVAVIDWRAGSGLPGLRSFIRSLPFGRLIAVDLLLAFGTGIGLLLLFVPGVVFLTFCFIAPVLVKVERLGPFAALRRSAHLVRGNFLRALVLAAMAMVGTELLAQGVELAVHEVAGSVVVGLAVGAAVEPLQAVLTVLVCLTLLEIHGSPPPAVLGRQASTPH